MNLLLELQKYNTVYLFVFVTKVLSGRILDIYINIIINFHPSLLPALPGIESIDKAMNYGHFLSGNIAHYADDGIDTGRIIMQNLCIIGSLVNYDDIPDRQIPMLIQIIEWPGQGRITIDDRKVNVKNANYSIGEYIPNLELDLNLKK